MKIAKAASRKIKYVSQQEMNEVLLEQKNKFIHYGNFDFFMEHGKPMSLAAGSCCIYDGEVGFLLTTNYKGQNTWFLTYKDCRDIEQEVNATRVYTNFCLYWSPPKVSAPECINATPILGYNPDYEGQRITAWSYDLNSAYSAAMLRGWIDTSKPPRAKNIDPEKEIGFEYDEVRERWVIQRRGYCMFVFDKMETPKGVREYINKWYEEKRIATALNDKKRKRIAKNHLNYVVGYFQRTNPYLRMWVICSCNEIIEELLDENTLYWNTDSIASRVRRYDIEENLGAGIGEWKMDHEGEVAYIGLSYQWNREKPSYRGVVKSWFPDDYDILRDPVPRCGNDWEFNKETLQLEAVMNGETSK